MSLPAPDRPIPEPRPRDEGRVAEVEVPVDLIDRVLEIQTPLEKKPGAVHRMRTTKSFRGFYHATNMLERLSTKTSLRPVDLGQLLICEAVLASSEEMAETDPKVTADLAMRIKLARTLSPITARLAGIADTRHEQRTTSSYEALFFVDAYEAMAGIGYELMNRFRAPKTEVESAEYTGFAQELTLHLMQYRKMSARQFTTPATVRDDFFRKGTRFDLIAHNLTPVDEQHVRAQVKAQRHEFGEEPQDGTKMIYGKQDMHNSARHPFWEHTMQAESPFPTLTALLDEAAGDTMDSEKLDTIAAHLHNKLFS